MASPAKQSGRSCRECHSADKKQNGNLLLVTQEATLKGGDTGPARIDFADPNKPEKPLRDFGVLCQAALLSPEFAVM